MAEETQLLEPGRAPRKRKLGKKQGRKKPNKKTKVMPTLQGQKKIKIDKKMKKLFRKRAREYNSDDNDDDDDHKSPAPAFKRIGNLASVTNQNNEEDIDSEEPSEDEEAHRQNVQKTNASDENNNVSEDEGEDGDIQPGITKFTEGCRAFRMAFRNIMKKSVSDDSLVSYVLLQQDYIKNEIGFLIV